MVFVTAYDQYAVEAFEREAVDYLLKPVSEERPGRLTLQLKTRPERILVSRAFAHLFRQM